MKYYTLKTDIACLLGVESAIMMDFLLTKEIDKHEISTDMDEIMYEMPFFIEASIRRILANLSSLEYIYIKRSKKVINIGLLSEGASIFGIDAYPSILEEKKIKRGKPEWYISFDRYVDAVKDGLREVLLDKEWIHKQELMNPRLDVLLSIRKSIENFWITEDGWINKRSAYDKNIKQGGSGDINWKTTIAKTLSYNAVYKDFVNKGQVVSSVKVKA